TTSALKGAWVRRVEPAPAWSTHLQWCLWVGCPTAGDAALPCAPPALLARAAMECVGRAVGVAYGVGARQSSARRTRVRLPARPVLPPMSSVVCVGAASCPPKAWYSSPPNTSHGVVQLRNPLSHCGLRSEDCGFKDAMGAERVLGVGKDNPQSKIRTPQSSHLSIRNPQSAIICRSAWRRRRCLRC